MNFMIVVDKYMFRLPYAFFYNFAKISKKQIKKDIVFWSGPVARVNNIPSLIWVLNNFQYFDTKQSDTKN